MLPTQLCGVHPRRSPDVPADLEASKHTAGLRGWTLYCYSHVLEIWNNHTDESETKLWHPSWNNIEQLVPLSEPLLCSCTSLWLRKGHSAVRGLCFSTSEVTADRRWTQTLFFACAWFEGRFIFRGEKATLSFHRINHSKIFVRQSQLTALHGFRHEAYSHSQGRRHYFVLSWWPNLSFQIWPGIILLFWISIFGNLWCDCMRNRPFHVVRSIVGWVPTMSQHPCDSHDVQCLCFGAIWVTPWEMQCGQTAKCRGENGSHHQQHYFSNLSFQESTVLLWTESHQSSPKVQKSKIFLFEFNLQPTSLTIGF